MVLKTHHPSINVFEIIFSLMGNCMISIKRENEAYTQALLFISITRSSGWKVVTDYNFPESPSLGYS